MSRAGPRRTPAKESFTVRRLLHVILVCTAFVTALPSRSGAWGMEVHRLITGLALDGLPQPLARLYADRRAFVVEHSVDPDLWRTADVRGAMGPEEPNHFLNIDQLGEPPPYGGVPRDWNAFVARYGAEGADKAGRLPWRTTEMYDRLVNAFKSMTTGSPYGADNARYLSAIVAHYVEDAHQPLHVVENYDGQLSHQRGVHGRFETELPLRYWARLAHPRVRVRPVAEIKTFMFDVIVDSAAAAPAVLSADARAAVGLARNPDGRLVYDDAYYARFFDAVRPVLESRLRASVDDVASVLVAAWTAGGSPEVK
jgi:hypothetical protein